MRVLFENEKVITTSDNKNVVLTTERIWKEGKEGGKSFYQSITLQQISSVQCLREEYIILLIIAILLFICSVYIGLIGSGYGSSQQTILVAIGGGIFLLLYFATKGSTVIVGSSSAKIRLSIKGMKKDKVFNFIDQIENAIAEKNRLIN